MIRMLVFLALAGCVESPLPTTTVTHDTCDGATTLVPLVASPHVTVGTPIEWSSNPPTSGPHWPLWAAWDRDYTELARGYWLHDLEHGGVVFAYRCDAGCPDVAGALDAIVRAQPDDPHCDAPVHHRALVVADPLLPADGTVYGVAWGTYYRASCVDAGALTAFYADNVGRGGENTCADGVAFDGTAIGE